jgi:hypothetical protein
MAESRKQMSSSTDYADDADMKGRKDNEGFGLFPSASSA